MKTKTITHLGLLVALAFIFSYIETLIPINLGIPGAKIGLANLVIIVALYTIGTKNAFILSVVRIVLVGFTFGNLSSMFYSLAGGMLSFLVMVAAKKTNKLSMTGVSVLGAVFHNVGQIIVAIFVVRTMEIIYYLPLLMLFGIVAGILIGVLAAHSIRNLTRKHGQ